MKQPMAGPTLRSLVLKSSGFGLLARVLTMAAALLSTPWLIQGLGVTRFGVYSVIISITGFATFMDAGFGTGVRTLVAEASVDERPANTQTVVASGVALLAVGALGLYLLFLASLPVLPWSSWLDSGSDSSGATLVALAVYVGLFAASLPLLAAQRTLEGLNRAHWVSGIVLIPSLILLAGSFALRSDGAKLGVYAALAGSSAAAAGLGGMAVLRARLPSAFPSPFRPSATIARRLWASSWPMVVVSVALSASYSLDPLLITANLGPSAVADYALAAKLSQMSNLVFVASAPVLWTHYARERASGRQAQISGQLVAGYAIAAILLGGALILVGPRATYLWSGGTVTAPRSLFAAFAVWGVVLAMHLPAASAQNDRNSLRFQAKTTTLMAVVNVGLSLLWVRSYGVAGPVWASAFALAVCHAGPVMWRGRKFSESLSVQ